MKFCGMCGTRVDRRMEERRGMRDASRAAAIANAQLPSPEAKRRVNNAGSCPAGSDPKKRLSRFLEGANQQSFAMIHRAMERCAPNQSSSEAIRNEPANGGRISGPSFLGLNSQPDNNGDVEYLLEDEPSGGGLRKFLLLVMLAAIIGLFLCNGDQVSKPAQNRLHRQNQIHPLQPLHRRETTSRQIASRLLLRIRLKLPPAEPVRLLSGAVAEVKAPKTEPTALETTVTQSIGHWLR